jgi:hypothetical protein
VDHWFRSWSCPTFCAPAPIRRCATFDTAERSQALDQLGFERRFVFAAFSTGVVFDTRLAPDVYPFSSADPHIEGGRDPLGRFTSSLPGLGPDVDKKFYAANRHRLLPPA